MSVRAEPSDSLPYGDAGLLLEATAVGYGVAPVRKVIAREALAAVRLVRLPEFEHLFDGGYQFVCDPAAAPGKSAAALAFGAFLADRLHGEFTEAKPSLS